jgi:hypothetical protein
MLYLVQYDLNREKDYELLIAEIKKSHGWAHLLLSTWGVETNETAQVLFNRIYAKMDKDDTLLVTQLLKGFGWSAFLAPNLVQWFKEAAQKA